jgi:hypothetical protein
MLILGILFGIGTILLVVAVISRLYWIGKYKQAVIAHLGDDWELYFDDQIMLDFYDYDMNASDCAREMIAANCEE